ncbi:hypothetical protein [Nocardia wallacei]|uniref:Uncharacterized protein n=1 Tax=Nocardia wallacei TaxID=480035 RepID=A0A7G1KLF9_9NOCA|nr:hypothetical protein [Nocardia wallacei]BCK56097.1 hypothetical protein NWFMUON74_38690 [Nocardia wallacei]
MHDDPEPPDEPAVFSTSGSPIVVHWPVPSSLDRWWDTVMALDSPTRPDGPADRRERL